MERLAICAVFKNEAPFLLEWIAYHRAIGFDRFFLYDNDSTDGGADLIRRSALGAAVRVVHWPRRPGQLAAYRHFIYNHAADFDWVAFIDIDEFLLPMRGDGIRELLPAWRDFSAVLVIENYVMRSPDSLPVNRHIKSFVRCSALLDVTENPHEFQVRGPVCDTAGRPAEMVGIRNVACHANLVLHHYMTRSRQDWMAKIRRGSAMFEYSEPKYKQELFEHFVDVSTVRDDAIGRFAPLVSALLAGPKRRVRPVPAASPVVVVAHIQHVGDVEAAGGDWVGTRSGGRWIEGFGLAAMADVAVEYRLDDSGWVAAGGFAGSRGMGMPIRGFAVRAAGWICRYRATFVGGAKTGWVTDGALCSAPGLPPVEAMQIVLRSA
jgi:hypothetical protein